MEKEIFYLNENIYINFEKADRYLLNKQTRPYIRLVDSQANIYAIPLRSNKNEDNIDLQLEVVGINNQTTYLDFSKAFKVLNDNIFYQGNKEINIEETDNLNDYLDKYFEFKNQNKIKHPVNETKILNTQRNLYLQQYLIKKNLSLKNKFICLNKKHEDTIASMSYNIRNNTVHCFSCGATYDLISLIKEEYDIKYKQSIEYIDKLIENDFKDSKLEVKVSTNEKTSNINYESILEYLKKSINELKEYSIKDNDYFSTYLSNRGISVETLINQNIGYDSKLNRLLFPTNFPKQSYIYKNLENGKDKGYFFVKGDQQNLNMNLNNNETNNVVFIVEGMFDALSFANEKQNFISMNSCNNINNTFELIKSLKSIYPDLKYCLALDNDKAGIEAQKQIADFLNENDLNYSHFYLHNYNDVNEFYCSDKNNFIKEMKNIILEDKTMEDKKEELLENNYIDKIKTIVDTFNTSEEDELKKTRKLKQDLSSVLDVMKNDQTLKTQKEIDKETERTLSGTVINVNDFPVKDRDNLVARNFWIENENGKKYSCKMYVNPNYESKDIKKGDVLSLTGNFKKYTDKEGTEKFNFLVSKLEKNTAQVQTKEVEQSR